MSSVLRRGGSAVAMTWDPKADPSDPSFGTALQSKRFLSIETAASEENSVGWVTPADPTGDAFAPDELVAGQCWWLRFRMDAKKLPASKMQMEIANAERARGKKLSARERRELKDDLHERLLPGILPRTTMVDVLVSPDRRTALVLSSSKAAREAFGELSNGSFLFYPKRLSAGELANTRRGEAPVGRLSRHMWPGGGPRQREMALVADFLGDEFLLWLWWRCETEGGHFVLPFKAEIGIVVHELVAFEAETEATSLVLRHGLTTKAAEARAALREGRVPTKLRLLIAEGSREWIATVDGSLSLGSVRLPEDAEDCESSDDCTADRAANWLRLHGIVEHLFDAFMAARLHDWETVAPEITEWMRGGVA